ncbi:MULTISPECIES: hypothetical protein [Streptomyces]|uniref:Transposase n=1 Tax=Streptomyces siderophoricus TaxID=2802281 RepID=A0ABS1N565_9ACTN|nr:hypothetical protein [Streptomyces sp. 9-7]MBL1095036.1 hypothetical protein [Streptomyces sp. 9-7]
MRGVDRGTGEVQPVRLRYATWHLLRRLRRRSRGKETTYYQLQVAQQHLRAAVYLLNWLEGQNLTLATCRQTDLERWMTGDDSRLRQAGHFVRGALTQKVARDLSFPAERWNGPSQPMDDEARWANLALSGEKGGAPAVDAGVATEVERVG